MAKKVNLLFVVLFAVISTATSAVEFETTTDLSVALDAFAHPQTNSIPADMLGPEYQLNGRSAVFWNVDAFVGSQIKTELRYGLSVQSVLDTQGAEPASVGADYRVDDLPSALEPEFSQSLDRFNINWYSPVGDFSLGRQPISFGQAKVFSPIDVIQPADIVAIDRSYRAGVDAIRGTWLLGAVSELDAGYVFGRDSVAFGRLKTFAFNADWEFIGLTINEELTIASLGVNGGVGAVGLWQESAVFLTADDSDFRVTVGVDTQFFDDFYVLTELHYNGLGRTENYAQNSIDPFYQLGAVTPNAQWYASAQASYPLNILMSLSVGATVNLNDGSGLVNGLISYNASDTLTVQIASVIPVKSETSFDEEFGLYPATLSLLLDWVF